MKDTAIHNQIISKKSTLPILMNAIAEGGIMRSTNLDVQIQTETDLADGLYRLVGGKWLPSNPELEVVEFPPAIKPDGKEITFALDRVAAKRLIACSSEDETRYVLNGVLFRVHEGGITLVSTDGRRLTVCEWETSKVPKSVFGDYIIPNYGKKNKHPLSMLMKDKKRDEIVMQTGKEYVSFSNGEQTITTRVVQGTYPNYKQVVPGEDEGMFYVDQAVMMAALKELEPYTADLDLIKINLKFDSIMLHAEDPSQALEHEVVVPAKHIRKPEKEVRSIALSVVYLIDSFAQEEGVVYVGYIDELSPICIGTQLEKKHGQDRIKRTDVTVQMPMRMT